MRVLVAAIVVLTALMLGGSTASAQPPRRPIKSGNGGVPPRPGATRGAPAAEDDSAVKPPAAKPGARFGSGVSSSESALESSEPAEEETRTAPAGRGGSRFGGARIAEETQEPSADEVSQEAPREEERTASLENRSTTRPLKRSREMMNSHEESEAGQEGAEPAPLSARGSARSIEAQAIQVKLNDTHAGAVLSAALNMQHDGAMTGYPIRLEQVVGATSDFNARRQAVKAYWNLVVSIADYHHALDEFDMITRMAANSNDKLVEAAAAGAEARVAEAKLIATAAQFDLASFSPSETALPIPADAPLIGEYRTEYGSLFGRAPAPIGIKRLAAMLPLYCDQVLARGRAVYAASEAQSRADDLTTFRELSAHRRAFLGAVRDYNDSIADYALQVATPSMSVATVTGMLIVRHTPAADSAPDLSSDTTRSQSEVVPATAIFSIGRGETSGLGAKPRAVGGFRGADRETQTLEEDVAPSDSLEEVSGLSSEASEVGDSSPADATEASAKKRPLSRFERNGTQEDPSAP